MSLAKTPRLSTPQWLQKSLVGAGLLAFGSWTASQYLSGWISESTLNYVKSTVGGNTIEPYSSTLTEPWSKVSYRGHSFCEHICILHLEMSKQHVKRFQIVATEFPLRSPPMKNSNTTTASVTFDAPDLMFPWTGTTPSLAILALGSQ